MSKKKTRRSESKYPSLDPKLNIKTRHDEIDYDYIDQLSEKEKEWLNNFTQEYIGASFDKSKKRIHRKKKVESEKNIYLKKLNEKMLSIIKGLNELIEDSNVNHLSKVKLKKLVYKFKLNLNKTIKNELVYIKDKYKKEAYDKNNARNRCIMTKARAQGKLTVIDVLPETYLVNEDVEDQMIEKLDFAKKFKDTEDNG